MKRLLALVPVLALASACSTSTGDKRAPTTKTVTATVTTQAAAVPSVTGGAASASPSSSPTAAGATPDACSLLTHAEAEQIADAKLMKAVGAGATPGGGFVQCQFTGPTSGPIAQVEVYVGDGAQQQLHIDRDNLKHHFVSIPGIGDQCLAEDGFIFVHKHGLWASIRQVRFGDPQQNAKRLRAGMAELAARLP